MNKDIAADEIIETLRYFYNMYFDNITTAAAIIKIGSNLLDIPESGVAELFSNT